jgi:N-acetylglucosaminyl-diphospho-decaprenol L-rhamnosyltransferase
MELSIIITKYKNPEMLRVCIDSIIKNVTLSDWELIVADSETEEDTALMMKEDYPEIIYLPSKENIGFEGTVRKGYAKCKGKYLLILNHDIIIKKGSIEKMLGYMKNNLSVGICGPKLFNFNETLQLSCFRFYTPLTILYRRTFLGRFRFAKKHLDRFLMKDFNHENIKEVDWLMGSALMTTGAAIEKVGLMDSRFKLYFEDVDWCRRFWENGLKVIYFPEARMYHYHGRGSASKNVFKALAFNKLAWIHIASAIKYFIKYWGKPVPKHG